MKRDMDLVRSILLAIEESNEESIDTAFEKIDCSDKVLQYHLGLLRDAGLIKAIDDSSTDGESYIPTGLTWKGHEFLDDIRDNTVWSKTKQTIGEKVGTASLAVMQEMAKVVVRTTLGLPG